MYVISVIAFMLYNIKVKKIKPDKGDIICFVAIVGIVISFWVCKQERIATIIESINRSKTDVDADGEFLNWISHRISMLQASINGDFSGVNIHRIHLMMKGCSLAWISSVSGWYIPALILVLNAVIVCFMAVYTKKNDSMLISIVTISFILKFVIGLVANLFLIYSTSVGVLFIGNIYDIIALFIILCYIKNMQIS